MKRIKDIRVAYDYMIIKKEELEEFNVLYREHYGIELTDAQTLDKATRLLRLMKIVLKATHGRSNQAQ